MDIRCDGCHQIVLPDSTGNIAYKKNKWGTFHPHCIRCYFCNSPMESYYDKDGKMACEACARLEEKVLFCAGCLQKIEAPPGGKVTYRNNRFGDFHPECVRCMFCRIPLTSFYDVNGKMSCESCARKNDAPTSVSSDNFSNREATSYLAREPQGGGVICDGCKTMIECPPGGRTNYKTNKFGNFHPSCVKCAVCRTVLDSFYEDDGRMLCKNCALPKCSHCGLPAEHSVTASSGTFHKDCFRCENCNAPLGPHYKVQGLNVCAACANLPVSQNYRLVKY
eukprot:Filipodium_phascolosomae@DN2019_c0_g1_i1.p1